ncbi:MAG: holo-ACP synthase [Rickettsiales bacterium]|jgi:holo-[acyl-carrier protein] synthase|nr:holo-ACP synthase [Rickettsiales bacterium]
MILGIGIDLIGIDRVRNVFLKFKTKFVDRTLSQEEKSLFFCLATEEKRVKFLAKRFSLKESFVKALGIGLGRGLDMSDISALHDEYGKPKIVVAVPKHRIIENIFGRNMKNLNFLVTATDQDGTIGSFVIIEEI